MLTGRLKGSALISQIGGVSSVALSLRGLPAGASLYSAGDGGIKRTPLLGNAVSLKESGICALVVVKDGRTLSEGFSGECGSRRTRILAEIRIMAAGEEETAPPEMEPEKPPEKPRGKAPEKPRKAAQPKPGAAVTEGILRQAERLFSALNAVNSAPAQNKEEDGMPISNPFPRTFPGSVWRVKEGDHRLFGEKEANGVKKLFIAVPVDVRTRGVLLKGRVVVSKDGRRYLVEQIL